MRLASIVSLIFRSSAYVAGLLVFNAASSLKATIYPAPTVTASAMPHSGSAASYAADQSEAEFVSADLGSATFLDFDLGAARTVDGFVNVTNLLPSSVIGNSRLIFDTDGTPGFDSATDTVRLFGAATTGSQGQGFINRFPQVTARYVRWEVLSVTGSSLSVGTAEVAFLGTSSGSQPLTGVSVINASPALSAQYAAENAINGIAGQGNLPGVEYASAGQGTNTFMDFDLGAVKPMTGVDLFDRLSGDSQITSFDLIFSNTPDFATSVAIRSFSKSGQWFASANFPTTEARYVRLKATGISSSPNVGVAEMTFYSIAPVLDGALDPEFNPNGSGASGPVGGNSSGTIYAVATQSDGRLIIGGDFTSYNGVTRNHVARIHPDGSLDLSFSPTPGSNNQVFAVTVQPDGKVVVGGWFLTMNGVPRRGIARLNADGSLDSSFDAGPASLWPVKSILVQSNGMLLVGGDKGLNRLQADGSLDGSFTQGVLSRGEVSSIVAQTDSAVLIGGTFSDYGGGIRRGIARIHLNGSLDESFAPGSGTDGFVSSVAIEDDGSIIIGGPFSEYNGIGSGGIARLKTSGSLDTRFDAGLGPDHKVYAVAGQRDGRIIVAGDFTRLNGTPSNRIARLDSDGAVDFSFIQTTGANDTIYCMAMQSDGRLVVGGKFTSFNGTSAGGIARLGINTPLVESPTVVNVTSSLTRLGGNVVSDRGGTITERGIVYSLKSANLSPQIGGSGVTKVATTGATGTFYVDAITPNQAGTYNFKAYATNRFGTGYTEVMSFTNVTPALPVLSGAAVRYASTKSADLAARIDSDGGAAVFESGVVYSLSSVNSDPVIGGVGVTRLATNSLRGPFSIQVPNLQAASSYSFKVYATNSAGTGYSERAVFTTTSGAHAVMETSDGPLIAKRVIAWGSRFGDSPTLAAQGKDVAAISIGDYHILALKNDGSVIAWGDNSYGQTVVPQVAMHDVIAVAAGGYHSLALKNDGTVIAWGDNSSGQCTLPIGFHNGLAIAAGSGNTMILKKDGQIIVLGNDYWGQKSVPVDAQSGVIGVTSCSETLGAVRSDGKAVAWGNSFYGVTTVPISAQSEVTSLTAGMYHFLALKSNGGVVAWGDNDDGQATVPTSAQSSVVTIASGWFHSIALKQHGEMIGWGDNTWGLSTIPVACQSGVRGVAAGGSNTAAIVTALDFDAQSLASSGPAIGVAIRNDGSSQLVISGISVVEGHSADFLVNTSAMSSTLAPGGTTSFDLSFKPSGVGVRQATLRFASNDSDEPARYVVLRGQGLPNPPTITNTSVSNITSTQALLGGDITNDGGSSITGRGVVYSLASENSNPELGDTGVRVIYRTGWTGSFTTAASGLSGAETYVFRVFAENSAGTTYSSPTFFVTQPGSPKMVIEQPAGTAVSQFVSWGDNAYVELNPPSSLSGVVALAAGDQHAVALKSDGSVVAWGGNSYGQRTVPAGLGGVTAIAAGSLHTVALKSDGSVVAWGNNSRGQCSVPTNAGSDVIAIAAGPMHTVAVKRDGSVIAWGDNSVGQCTVPASLNSVIAVAAAVNYTLALKSDGTLEAWGWSSYASYSRFSVPAGLGGVVAIAAGDRHSAALKADGTVQVWGFNEYGQKDIPAGLNNVVAISAGHNHTMALKGDGSVVAWGANYQGQSYVPDRAQSSMSMITAGGNYSLASGAVTLSCGARPIATAPVESAVTIHNTGTSALTITGVNLTGDNAGDFILNTSGMATRILAGGSTSFKVAFVPTATGLRKTALRILSDDPSQGIWDAVLIATGTPVLPEITNPSISAVTALAATLGGDVTSAGGAPVTQRGVVYARTAVNADPFIGGIGTTVISTSGGTGPFTVNVTGLSGMSGYSFKAFASNGSIAYSPVATFTTGTWITSINDSGAGSLREAFANAAAHPGPDVIYVSPSLGGQTISATSLTVAGTSNDNAFVIDDPDGVTLDASELTNYLKITKPGTAGFNGRLFYVRTGSLTLRGITLENSGEAVLNAGILTLDRCTLTGNSATSGRGGALSNLGSATLTQCTITGNTAIQGGGVYSEGPLTVIHCTITRNTATDSGGGVYASQPLTLTNSIVWGNTAPSSGADIANLSTVRREGVSIVRGVRDPASLTGSGLFIDADPLLGEPAMQGGSTATMLPTLGSPAIDQATILSPSLTLDQRGGSRPLGVQPDIGAVEVNVITVTTPVDELDPPGFVGSGISLREAIRDTAYGGTIRFDRATFTGATASTNTITLTRGPLSPQRTCTLDGSLNPGGISIVYSPTVTLQPQTVTVESGAAASFNVAVTNLSGGVMYQWRKDGINLGGKTTATLSMASTQETDEGLYDVLLTELPAKGYLSLNNVVKGAFSTVSQPASLIVDDAALTIQRGPSAAMLALGASYTLRVTAIAQASAALTYQWKKNGVTIKGATQSSYLISNAQLSHAGAYTCEVKSGTTSLTSGTAEIGVVDTRAKTLNLIAGSSFTAAVSAAGNGLSYAWKRNATALPAAANSFLIKPVATGDAGIYTCTVTGLAGVISGGCNTTLTVCDSPPAIKTPLELPAAAIGQFYFYQIPAQVIAGAPATSFLITGTLPAGITYNKSTGIISGRPTTTKPAGYPLTIKAWNLKGYSPATLATLMVNMVPSTALGTFAGPMERSPLNDNLGGRFDLTTSGSGLCSGSITLGGRPVLRFTNQLLLSAGAGDLILHANIPGITMADKTVLIAYLEVFASDQRAVLTLVHPTLGTTLTTPAWRTPWLISKTPALNNPATAFAATYTARLDAGNGGTTSPSGYGYASFTISTAGTLTLAGKLPDGSAVSGGAFVSKDGEIALFNLLYATTNRGSHVGQLVITPNTPVANNVVAGTTTWFKPAPLTATSTDTIYKAGFGPLTVTAAGAPYVAPLKGALAPGFTTVALGSTNAKLNFTLGNLDVEAREFSQLLRITSPSASSLTNTAIPALPLTNTTKMTAFTASSGLFTGSFTINGATTTLNRPASFYGQLVTIGATTQGYGYFLLPTATAKISTSPKLSGRVVLGVP